MGQVAEMRNEIVVAPVTPMDLIQRAAAEGASIEMMERLFELKLRVEDNEAQKAYNEAFSLFKAEAIHITKNVSVSDGPLKGKKYADLFGVVSAVTPALSAYGLSHSWKLTKDEPTWMEVTCTIRHIKGHSESVSMGAAPDTGPGRNAIQARGSAKSYLERYTLLGALGLAAADGDNDANGSKPGMPEPELVEALDAIAGAAHLTELHSIYAAHYKIAQKLGDQAAMNAMIAAKDKTKASLA